MDMNYIDPEEEFELMYGDEMEMLREMEEDFEPPSTTYSKPKSKRSLDFDQPSTSTGGITPIQKQPHQPSTSGITPIKKPTKEVANIDVPSSNVLNTSLSECSSNSLECQPLDKVGKRTVSELFGDIDDIEDIDSFSEQFSKRRKVDDKEAKEERQNFLIELIKSQRKQNSDDQSFRENKQAKGLTKKIEDCMTRNVPKWAFIATTDSSGQRVYLRLRSDEYRERQFKISQASYNNSGLLGVPYEILKQAAFKERKKKEDKVFNEANRDVVEVVDNAKKDLWVERYKPKIYLELLSDESTNRSLLQWLKLWDKLVFNRVPPMLKKMEQMEKKTVMDEHGRPLQKVALLCGPPGLGKTTLAHMIACQAGYNIVEVNASDDRTAQVFKVQLEAATQMKSVMGQNPKPNCLILDEIDGAPQAAIDVLVKFVTEKSDKKKKKKAGILKRPIICICNDIYVPALRSLRQIAFTVNFPPISSVRLGERLMEISCSEKILSDLGTMMALSEKTHNDIRSCLSVLHCLKSKGERVTLTQIQAANMGIKDVQQGLFSVWQLIFHIKLKTKVQHKSDDSALDTRFHNVLRAVQSYGDYERLSMGVFENFLNLRPKDSSLKQVVKTLNWFKFHDLMTHSIQSSQNYALYPYLPYSFVAWSQLLSTIHWPKLQYPSTAYEMTQRQVRFAQILDFSLVGMPPSLQAFQHKEKLLLDVIPYLIHLIIPNLRPVSIQLYTSKERAELDRVVKIMADYNLNYTQERTTEGSYVFNLDPNIEDIGFFGERPRERIFGYAGKQMISREVESEKIKRAQNKMNNASETISQVNTKSTAPKTGENVKPASPAIPNHLQKLTPKALKKKVEMDWEFTKEEKLHFWKNHVIVSFYFDIKWL